MGEAHLNSMVGDSYWLIFVGVRIGDGTTRTDDVLAEVLDFLVSVSTQVINCSDALGYYCSAKVPSKVKRVPQVVGKGSRRVWCFLRVFIIGYLFLFFFLLPLFSRFFLQIGRRFSSSRSSHGRMDGSYGVAPT
jgi:hypothetical protein